MQQPWGRAWQPWIPSWPCRWGHPERCQNTTQQKQELPLRLPGCRCVHCTDAGTPPRDGEGEGLRRPHASEIVKGTYGECLGMGSVKCEPSSLPFCVFHFAGCVRGLLSASWPRPRGERASGMAQQSMCKASLFNS